MSETSGFNLFDPGKPVWRCELNGPYVTAVFTDKQCVPNAFHRFMQRLAFGVKWIRIEGEDNGRA